MVLTAWLIKAKILNPPDISSGRSEVYLKVGEWEHGRMHTLAKGLAATAVSMLGAVFGSGLKGEVAAPAWVLVGAVIGAMVLLGLAVASSRMARDVAARLGR